MIKISVCRQYSKSISFFLTSYKQFFYTIYYVTSILQYKYCEELALEKVALVEGIKQWSWLTKWVSYYLGW